MDSLLPHVFTRHDAVCKPLQSPYDGPYRILKRTDKHFTIAINNRNDTVSIDRLKPAYLDIEQPERSQTHTTTHLPSLPPPPPLLVLGDMSIFHNTSLITCPETLGGGGGGVV